MVRMEMRILTEADSAGSDFLAVVCKKWETEALEAVKYGVRVVLLRTGNVIGKEGVLKQMLPMFKLFIGGTPGNGKQWFSWIHIDDLVNIIQMASENTNIDGPINATSPNPINMREFTKTLGKVMHRPSFIRIPYFVLRTVLGEIAIIIVTGQKVIPQKLIQANYVFKFPGFKDALINIL